MTLLFRGLCAALLASALLAAPALADRTATIRVEGTNATLVPKTAVTVPDSGSIPGADAECTWNEAAGALEKGTGGDWSRSAFVTTIKGETQPSTRGWFYVMNGKWGAGFCFDEMPPGADIAVYASDYDADYNPTELMPFLRGVPSSVERGQPFTVSVVEFVPQRNPDFNYYEPGTGTERPAAGVTVVAGDKTATTGADGKATLTLDRTGQFTVQARRGTSAARSEQVRIGVREPGTPPPPAPPKDPLAGSGGPSTPDLQAPITLIKGIREGRTYRRGKGPRVLRGTAGVRPSSGAPLQADPSGIRTVKIRLTRNAGGDCSAYSVRRERFVARPCGARHGWYFKVAERSDWRYLLPSRLPRGRYVLDAAAIDGAYNRDRKRRRGENRVVFRVR